MPPPSDSLSGTEWHGPGVEFFRQRVRVTGTQADEGPGGPGAAAAAGVSAAGRGLPGFRDGASRDPGPSR